MVEAALVYIFGPVLTWLLAVPSIIMLSAFTIWQTILWHQRREQERERERDRERDARWRRSNNNTSGRTTWPA